MVVGALMRSMCMLLRITVSTAVIRATSGRTISSNKARAARPPRLVLRSTSADCMDPSVSALLTTALAVVAVESMTLIKESTCCFWLEAGSDTDNKDTNKCTTAARQAVGKSTSSVVVSGEEDGSTVTVVTFNGSKMSCTRKSTNDREDWEGATRDPSVDPTLSPPSVAGWILAGLVLLLLDEEEKRDASGCKHRLANHRASSRQGVECNKSDKRNKRSQMWSATHRNCFFFSKLLRVDCSGGGIGSDGVGALVVLSVVVVDWLCLQRYARPLRVVYTVCVVTNDSKIQVAMEDSEEEALWERGMVVESWVMSSV